MKLKLNQKLFDANDKEIKFEGEIFDLKNVIVSSLLMPDKDDTEKQKQDKYDVYRKVKGKVVEADLKLDELTLIKKVIGKFQPQLIMGQCFEMIEGVTKDK